MSRREEAARAIDGLAPGLRAVGLTRGEFDLLDLLYAVLAVTGPAEVIVSTWTVGLSAMDELAAMRDEGQVHSLRFIVDRSFSTRHARYRDKYRGRLLELFGADAVTETRTHAKHILVRSEGMDVAIRSSANLNRNPRCESYDVDACATLAGFLWGLDEQIIEATPPGLGVDGSVVEAVFQSLLGDDIDWAEPSIPSPRRRSLPGVRR